MSDANAPSTNFAGETGGLKTSPIVASLEKSVHGEGLTRAELAEKKAKEAAAAAAAAEKK